MLPFDGGPLEQAVRTQAVQVLPPDGQAPFDHAGDWRVLAPVTERGESIGLLELFLEAEPEEDVVGEIALVAHLLAFGWFLTLP